MINKESPLPIYYQIEELIKKQIHHGTLQPGDALPSERELAELYNVSRMTARHAITNLVNKNLLYREKGKGTFVAQKKIEQLLSGLTSFTEEMELRGLHPESQLVDFRMIAASSSIAENLQVEAGTQVHFIKRVRMADSKPISLEASYIPVSLIPELTFNLVDQSFYQYVENDLHLQIDYGTQLIESTLSTDEEEKYLQLETTSPILSIRRQTYLVDGRMLELVYSSYRADRYQYTTTMQRKR